MTVLSYLCGIIMDREIHAPCRRYNFVDCLNATGKGCLK